MIESLVRGSILLDRYGPDAVLDDDMGPEGLTQLLKVLEDTGCGCRIGEVRIPTVGSLFRETKLNGRKNDFRGMPISKHNFRYNRLPREFIALSALLVANGRVVPVVVFNGLRLRQHEIDFLNECTETIKNRLTLINLDAAQQMRARSCEGVCSGIHCSVRVLHEKLGRAFNRVGRRLMRMDIGHHVV